MQIAYGVVNLMGSRRPTEANRHRKSQEILPHIARFRIRQSQGEGCAEQMPGALSGQIGRGFAGDIGRTLKGLDSIPNRAMRGR